jgi:hypothetical protein
VHVSPAYFSEQLAIEKSRIPDGSPCKHKDRVVVVVNEAVVRVADVPLVDVMLLDVRLVGVVLVDVKLVDV